MLVKKHDKKWIYLPIETKVRELDAKLLLAYYAVQENFNVVLGLSGLVEEALDHLPKGIFLDKGYKWEDKLRRFETAKNNGHITINLEEEGFPLTEKELYLNKHLSKESLKHLDYEFCWGEVQKETITKAYPLVEKKCSITGNPRFDLLKYKYRALFKEKEEKIKNQYGKFILVNTRFPLFTKAVNDDGTINHKTAENLKKTYGKNIYNKMSNEYKAFIDMIKKASKRYPHINFVIRPHPSDKFTVYERDLVNCKNTFIVHDGNVINWILASKLVIHNGCTTGVESFLLEKPVISYIPVKEGGYDLPNELSIKVYNLTDIYKIIDEELDSYVFTDNKFEENKKMRLLSKHYAGTDSFAYKNILQHLKRLPVQKSSVRRIDLKKELLTKLKKESSKRIYQVNTIVKQKFPDLTAAEIEIFFLRLNQIENNNPRIKVRKLYDKLFEITSG